MPSIARTATLGLLCCLAAPQESQAAPQSLCDQAALSAAQRYEVPEDLMLALARVESGRSAQGVFGPWPWATNVNGSGRYFGTKAGALEFLTDTLSAGTRNFDVGCFQINHRWHGQAFENLEQMLDPDSNADYAARFLKRLQDETGSWDGAIGAYHSRTEDLAQSYRDRFHKMAGAEVFHPITPRKPNSYSLLQDAGRPVGHASLVPDARVNAFIFPGAKALLP